MDQLDYPCTTNDYFLNISVSDYSGVVYQEEKEKTKKKILQKSDTNKSGL